jgi:hypothetical protein
VSGTHFVILTTLAMVAIAGNSLLIYADAVNRREPSHAALLV